MRRLISSPCRSPASSSTISIFVIAISGAVCTAVGNREFLKRLRCELRQRRGGVGLRPREEQPEGGAGARFRFDFDGAAVRGDDLLHEREPEAGAAARLRIGKLRAVVRLKNVREIAGVDSDPAVFDFDDDQLVRLTQYDVD